MIYSQFQDKQLSLLGFGAMRLPTLTDGSINQELVNEMTDYALSHGINYFDTAYSYHDSMSEIAIGKALARHPRESFYLATKIPGHQTFKSYNPADFFEEQLKKCGVDYFDFYLLHNVCEESLSVYTDPKWDIVNYLKEQKRMGRIKHLGMSTHARVPALKQILELFGEDLEFAQIQLNYLDWTLQDAQEKVRLLKEYDIPVWVMEPVRGGKLANLNESQAARLQALNPGKSTASFGFRFLQGIDNVQMVLSGMSTPEQMMDNVATFESRNPLSPEETAAVFEIAEELKGSVPCTACRYCCEGCPMGLNIPLLIETYNDLRVAFNVSLSARMEAMPADKLPSACIGCGKCAKVCPQNIDIPGVMKDFAQRCEAMPSWAAISRHREEAAHRLKQIT